MHFEPVRGLPRLHVTPLPIIRVEPPRIIVEVDDDQEKRIRFIFRPYQAMRLITDDCFRLPPGLSILPQRVVEVIDSPWILELREALKRNDETATFMNNARHFLFPLQDDFLEIVAWDLQDEASRAQP